MAEFSSSVVGTLKKDRNKYKLDMFDSMRYFFQTYFLEFARNLGLGGSFIHCIDSFSVKSKVDELG